VSFLARCRFRYFAWENQLGILGFGLLVDGNIGIGILAEGQEFLVPLTRTRVVANHFLRPCHLQTRQGSSHLCPKAARMIQ